MFVKRKKGILVKHVWNENMFKRVIVNTDFKQTLQNWQFLNAQIIAISAWTY